MRTICGPMLADVLPLLPRAHRRLILALHSVEAELATGEAFAEIGTVESWRVCREIVQEAIDATVRPFARDILGEEVPHE